MPQITIEQLEKEFDEKFPKNEFGGNMIKTGHTKLIINRTEANKIKSFYRSKMRELLEGILPKEVDDERTLFEGNELELLKVAEIMTPAQIERHMVDFKNGYNYAITEMRKTINDILK